MQIREVDHGYDTARIPGPNGHQVMAQRPRHTPEAETNTPEAGAVDACAVRV